MSAAEAEVAFNTAMSVTARASSIILQLARDVEEPADQTLAIAHVSDPAPQPAIEAETAAGGLDREQEHQHGEEHVGPRPLGGIVVESEPELQRICDRQHAHEAHRKPQH